MPYIALKHVKFDREYVIGETIPDHVVDPSRAAALVGMKLIAALAAAAPQESAQDDAGTAGDAQVDTNASEGDAAGAAQEPAGAADGESKADAPQTDENGAEGAQEPAETAQEDAEPEKKPKSKK